MNIDMHAHFTPPEWVEEIRRNGSQYGCVLKENKSGQPLLQIGDQKPSPVFSPLLDLIGGVNLWQRVGLIAKC